MKHKTTDQRYSMGIFWTAGLVLMLTAIPSYNLDQPPSGAAAILHFTMFGGFGFVLMITSLIVGVFLLGYKAYRKISSESLRLVAILSLCLSAVIYILRSFATVIA